MGKNKKNNNRKPQQPARPSEPVQKITPAMVDTTNSIEEKVNAQLSEMDIEPKEELSPESAKKYEDNLEKENVGTYFAHLQELTKKVEAVLEKAQEKMDKANADREELDGQKKEFEKSKKEFQEKQEQQNKREKELDEERFAIDNGVYSEVISSLIASLKKQEEKIFSDTESRMKDISDLHAKTLQSLTDNIKEQESIENEKTNLSKEKRALAREKAKFEMEKETFKEDIKDEYEAKFGSELKSTQESLERYKAKNQKLEEDNSYLQSSIDSIRSAFDGAEPKDMVAQISEYKARISELIKERDDRPSPGSYDEKLEEITRLKEKVGELESQINEKELAELRVLLASEDNFSMERMNLKSQIENAKIREEHNLRHIAALEDTIKLLKEDKSKTNEAFEFAKKVDWNDTFQLQSFIEKNPSSLADFVNYIQGRMIASRTDDGQETSFYYDKETIRIFLAGLNMSPISILQGISGTGKTSLPREFAKALYADPNYRGINPEDRKPNAPYRICAIQSGWRDNMDLMGYFNSFDNKYKETDFFQALYLANQPKYQNTLFFIILDEMNLSRPEHYFADFLSLLEQSPEERFIKISNTPEEAYPESIVGGQLPVPPNVRFIGTANHDETTLEFAPKTYDRSNLMEMPRNKSNEGSAIEAKYNVSYSWLNEQFSIAESKYSAYYQVFEKFINDEEFKELIEQKNIGVGNRFEKQAKKFITTYIASGTGSPEDLAVAADHLITSRLFRTLKNRYDLDVQALQEFKESYTILFNDTFKVDPKRAISMLDAEISSK